MKGKTFTLVSLCSRELNKKKGKTIIILILKKSEQGTRKKGLEPTWLGDMGNQLLVKDSWFLNFPSKLLSKSSTENLQTALPRMALRGVVNTP